jgi:hypothetical protein
MNEKNDVNIELYEVFKQEFKLSDDDAKNFAKAVEIIAKDESYNTYEDYKNAFREYFVNLELEKQKSMKC